MTRGLIVALLLGAAAAPMGADAQPSSRVPRSGVLTSATSSRVDVFRQGLRDLGYVEGQNITIEYRSSDGNAARLAGLAPELVYVVDGGLMAYGPIFNESYRRAASYVDKILKGARPPISPWSSRQRTSLSSTSRPRRLSGSRSPRRCSCERIRWSGDAASRAPTLPNLEALVGIPTHARPQPLAAPPQFGHVVPDSGHVAAKIDEGQVNDVKALVHLAANLDADPLDALGVGDDTFGDGVKVGP